MATGYNWNEGDSEQTIDFEAAKIALQLIAKSDQKIITNEKAMTASKHNYSRLKRDIYSMLSFHIKYEKKKNAKYATVQFWVYFIHTTHLLFSNTKDFKPRRLMRDDLRWSAYYIKLLEIDFPLILTMETPPVALMDEVYLFLFVFCNCKYVCPINKVLRR